DRKAPLRGLAQQGHQALRLSGHHDEPVEVALERFRERFLLADAEPGIGAMDEPHVARLDPSHGLQDAVADEVEERRDLGRQVDADLQLLARGQEACGEVRPVAHGLRLVEDPGAGFLIDAGPVVKRAVDRADRHAEALRDLANPRRLLPCGSPLLARPVTHLQSLSICARSAYPQGPECPREGQKGLDVPLRTASYKKCLTAITRADYVRVNVNGQVVN